MDSAGWISPQYRDVDRLDALLAELKANAARPRETARSMPPSAYVSEALADLEAERIFRCEWHCVGRADELAEPGAYLTDQIAAEPIVVLCDGSGSIRAYSNVCRHRLGRLLVGSGHVRAIVCPYHAWTYDLRGRLTGAPYMAESFSAEGICLPELRVEVWQGWIYVTLDPETPALAPRLADLEARLSNYRLSDYRALFRVDETWNTNWKALVENFTETYHLFQVHRTTVEPALPTRLTRHDEPGGAAYSLYTQERRPGVSYEYDSDMAVANPALTDQERKTYPITCIYPAQVISISPERLFWMALQPIGSTRVRVRWGVDVFPGSLPDGPEGERRTADLRAAFDAINAEDKAILETLYQNAASRTATTGPLSPKERALWEFQGYLARRLCSQS